MHSRITPRMGDEMIPAFNAALSGMQAFGTKIQSNSNNIANVSTEGFKKTRVTLANQSPYGVKASVETVDEPGTMLQDEMSQGTNSRELSNVNLAEELPESRLNVRFYQANMKTMQTVDEMTESLLKIKV